MFLKKSILGAGVIALCAALPVLATDISVDAAIGATPEDMTTVTMREDSAFLGNEVRTQDQIVIGNVEGVFAGANGEEMLVITLKSDVGSKSGVKTFTVPVAADAVADGAVTLGWTEAELFTALSSNLEQGN